MSLRSIPYIAGFVTVFIVRISILAAVVFVAAHFIAKFW